jgi:ribonuclease HII
MARPASDSPTLFELPLRPDFSIEKRARRKGQWPVAGLDEAGRGPLAGPVVAAAVILDPRRIPDGLDDSKRLSFEAREALFAEITASAVAISVCSMSATAIDGINILRASLEAMRRALCGLSVAPMLALADGRDVPPGLPCEGRAVVKGDQISQSIAAASIVAKVTRDRMMSRTCGIHPAYGFSSHMGYATEVHRAAILAHGRLQRLHRMTFGLLKETVIADDEAPLLVAQDNAA